MNLKGSTILVYIPYLSRTHTICMH